MIKKLLTAFLFITPIAVAGCSVSANVQGNVQGGPPEGCSADTTLACSGNAIGYACDTGDNPEDEDTSLSCSTPVSNGGEDDYCCFDFVGGGTCVADDNLTSSCSTADSYGYQCASGDNPNTLDPSLTCSTHTPDSDGVHDDYCCTYDGTSTGDDGSPPTGCTADSSLSCTGNAVGFSCASGDNPEEEQPSYSCSTPVTDSEGNDDYCCFNGFGGGGSTTCIADDGLTSSCATADSYGFQCASGDDPSTLDPSLTCSGNTPDPDGEHDDYCCTYN